LRPLTNSETLNSSRKLTFDRSTRNTLLRKTAANIHETLNRSAPPLDANTADLLTMRSAEVKMRSRNAECSWMMMIPAAAKRVTAKSDKTRTMKAATILTAKTLTAKNNDETRAMKTAKIAMMMMRTARATTAKNDKSNDNSENKSVDKNPERAPADEGSKPNQSPEPK